MSNINPIPNTRVSNLLLRQRLTHQYQTDQLDLFRLQEQISTGQRISLPSEDAPAALRSIALQRLLERKSQLETNINGGQYFLGATEAAIADVAKELADIKGATLGVAGTVTTQSERDGVINRINGFLDSLVGIANRQFQGQYLFAGTQTSQQPYAFDGESVAYSGDDYSINNYSDLGVLFSTNATGQAVFGGISQPVIGTIDLNPQLNAETRLSSLRGGRGISAGGAISISDGNNISLIDISGARTVGDVVRLIEENPPPTRTIDVRITGDGISLSLDSGSILISEVGNGTAARELGILELAGAATKVGSDLDPLLLKTTSLDNLLGTKARALIDSGANNDNADILLEASSNGAAFDGVTVQFVDGTPATTAGNEIANYDANTKTLSISIDPGDSDANQVVAAINAEGTFSASLDPSDTASFFDAGTGKVVLNQNGTPAVTTGGSGAALDQSSGIRVQNGGQTFDITFENAETVEDLLNILNSSGAGLHAEVNAKGTGINVRSRLSGQDFQIGELNGGLTATQLGIRTYTANTKLSDFNYGVGVPTSFNLQAIAGTDFTITTSDGLTVDVNLSSATSLAEVVTIINAATTLAAPNVTASLPVPPGNVLELVENPAPGAPAQQFTVTQATGSLAGQYLGLIPNGQSVGTATGNTLTGDDERYIDFTITDANGQAYDINLSGATTVGDALATINAITGGAVTAQLAASGNGIELVDTTAGADSLTVDVVVGSQTAEFLGLVAKGETQNASTSNTLTGTDQNFLETDSVFNTLLRLRDALTDNDIVAIERAIAKVDSDIGRVTSSRAEVGARVRGLKQSRQSLQDEEIQLRSALSDEIDVDLVEAISQLTARQISLEASLRSTANILQLSLLNFI